MFVINVKHLVNYNLLIFTFVSGVKNVTNYNILGGDYHHNLLGRPKGGLPLYIGSVARIPNSMMMMMMMMMMMSMRGQH